MTDGDTDALENMRRNVDSNLGDVVGLEVGNDSNVEEVKSTPLYSESVLPCIQLRWGQNLEAFKTYVACKQNVMQFSGFDVIMGSDIIYVEEILDPLFDTVIELLSDSAEAFLLLAYARRNVKIDLVFECADRHAMGWKEPEGVEGVFIFSRLPK